MFQTKLITSTMMKNFSRIRFRFGYRYCSSNNKCGTPPPRLSVNCAILGKNAIVTGAANGMGLAATKTLLKYGANKVFMLDIDDKNGESASKELNNEHGRDCTSFLKVDVTCHEKFEEAFKKSVKLVKRLDIVFNNAGILNDHKWEETVDINTTSLIRGTLFGFKYMGFDQGGCGGTIINHASILGLQPLTRCPVYVGTKHATIGMTRSWGSPFWFDRTGVKIMAICSGNSPTNLLKWTDGADDPLIKEMMKEFGNFPEQPLEKWGESFATILTKGSNGSIWVTENSQISEVEIPERSSLKHKN